jgi:hypothetical protein
MKLLDLIAVVCLVSITIVRFFILTFLDRRSSFLKKGGYQNSTS